ncbi:hypothetical protein Pelo_15595 [Pelomyxa schiedti]|nr:hypothetical protein Pelo_15595 [Pelomyxa schiedti]
MGQQLASSSSSLEDEVTAIEQLSRESRSASFPGVCRVLDVTEYGCIPQLQQNPPRASSAAPADSIASWEKFSSSSSSAKDLDAIDCRVGHRTEAIVRRHGMELVGRCCYECVQCCVERTKFGPLGSCWERITTSLQLRCNEVEKLVATVMQPQNILEREEQHTMTAVGGKTWAYEMWEKEWVQVIRLAVSGASWCGWCSAVLLRWLTGGAVLSSHRFLMDSDLIELCCRAAVETEAEIKCLELHLKEVGSREEVIKYVATVKLLKERVEAITAFLFQCTTSACIAMKKFLVMGSAGCAGHLLNLNNHSFHFQNDPPVTIKSCAIDDYAASAASYGDPVFLEWFLNTVGGKLSDIDPHGKSMTAACKAQSFECLELLITRGPDLITQGICSVLTHVLREWTSLDNVRKVLELLLSTGLDINKPSVLLENVLLTPLQSVLENGRLGIAEYLLRHNPELKLFDLLLAIAGCKASEECLGVVTTIVERLRVKIPPEAVLLAVLCATPEVLEYLLNKGGEVNVPCTHSLVPKSTKWVSTFGDRAVFPLQAAMLHCSVTECEVLLGFGACIPEVYESHALRVHAMSAWDCTFVELCRGAHSHSDHSLQGLIASSRCRSMESHVWGTLDKNSIHPCRHARIFELLFKYGAITVTNAGPPPLYMKDFFTVSFATTTQTPTRCTDQNLRI